MIGAEHIRTGKGCFISMAMDNSSGAVGPVPCKELITVPLSYLQGASYRPEFLTEAEP